MYNIDLTPDFLTPDYEPVTKYNSSSATEERIPTDRSMTKAELADHLGISRRTLYRWIRRLGEDNIPGYQKESKLLTPGTLKYLSERICF